MIDSSLGDIDPDQMLCSMCLHILPSHHSNCPEKTKQQRTKEIFLRIGTRGHQFNLTEYERARCNVLRLMYSGVPQEFLRVALVLGRRKEESMRELQVHSWIDLLFPSHLRGRTSKEEYYL